eukprot:11198442-Lingulodinium_polyedra.AAC.1
MHNLTQEARVCTSAGDVARPRVFAAPTECPSNSRDTDERHLKVARPSSFAKYCPPRDRVRGSGLQNVGHEGRRCL